MSSHLPAERHTADERYRTLRSHDTFFDLIQNSPLGVYLVDADFRMAQVSAGAQKVFENVRPLLGRDFHEVLHIVWPEPFASEALAIFEHTFETGEPYHSADTTQRRGDTDETESYDWQIERVTMPDGRYGVVCYFYDLTELRQAQEALSESEERTRQFAESEHATALRLQRALLPRTLFQHASVELAARYEAGSDTQEVGGDWYDSFELPGGRIGLTVGDVVGHGLDAAAAMGRMRTALAALASRGDSPAAVLHELSSFVAGPDGTDFATAWYGVLDPVAGVLQYASAGHPPMLLVGPDGSTRWLDEGRSVPLGTGAHTEVARRQATVDIDPEAVLLLYSDGLVERRGERLSEGLHRLERLAAALCREPLETICAKLVDDLGLADSRVDDTVVMAMRFMPAAAPGFSQTYSAQPQELRRMRADLRQWLAENAIPLEQHPDLLLAVGEASANAVEHAYVDSGPGTVVVEVTRAEPVDGLQVRVQDFGQWRDSSRADEDRGRGTEVMKALVDDFERSTGTAGTTVTFRVRRRTSSAP